MIKKQKYEKDAIIAEIASLYYEHDMSQDEIAKKMFYSKSKVSRIIKQAKERGIVKITISYPLERMKIAESALLNNFDLKDAIVIKNYPETNEIFSSLSQLGKMAANYLDAILKDGDIVGMAWGRTLFHTIEELKPRSSKDIKIVQVLGFSADDYNHNIDSPNLIRIMADKYKTNSSLLFAPLYVKNNIVHQALLNEPIIKKTLKEAEKVNYLISGIAKLEDNKLPNSWAGYLEENDRKRLMSKGAIGYICGHFINARGEHIQDIVEDNMIGLSFEKMQEIENVILISGGVDKTEVTYAALKGRLISHLITDDETAMKLIEMHKRGKR